MEPPPSVQEGLEAVKLFLRYNGHQEKVGMEEKQLFDGNQEGSKLYSHQTPKTITLDSWLG
ncbi:hypothetical protein K469DRAFT_248036 [Zopfia rhizophila CBS 207.26]|uniref:Uncharacterized protein n=1 Tax=Zopfia rhizophila CBS 207.26 TaxID=1314779 RepID=A0A6A6DVJ9_9PEZI|nr:hypothetical protein K469DRAFT_248036 [Zopfia rhizophila CBS 207.26]